MAKNDIKDAAGLVAYLTDCTLATVESLKMRKSASKHETERQISIAQTAIDYGLRHGVSFKGTRASSVISHYGSVEEWAKQYSPSPPSSMRSTK